MAEQWLRRASLKVVDTSGSGLDLSALRFTFHTKQADVETPQAAYIRVYNLLDTTAAMIGPGPTSQYSRVTLQAGYEGFNGDGPFGILVDGTIKQTRSGREGALDSYLDILAADGDIEMNTTILSYALQAGSTPQSRLQAMVKNGNLTLSPGGPDPEGPTLPRGKIVHLPARAELHTFAATHNLTYSFQNGQLVFLPLLGFKPGEAVVINAQTGMIGYPEQTESGIKVRMLINPKLDVGCKLQIDNKSILMFQQNLSPTGLAEFLSVNTVAGAPLNADGIYRIHVIEHIGDTRGEDWYSDVICLSSTQPTNNVLAPKFGP